MRTLGNEELSKIINVAVASSKVKTIKTPFRFERPFIHILIYGSIGSGKSSIMEQIEHELKISHFVNLNKAHIVGSVDKTTGELMTPAIWDCRNSVLLIDEFYVGAKDFVGRDALRLLLSVMEKASYTKKVGYRCNSFHGKDEDLFCDVDDHQIKCKTRFVFFGNTMMNLRGTKLQEIKALMTRCLVIPYYPTLDDLKEKARGKPSYTYKHYKVKEHIKINKTNYNRLLDLIENRKVAPDRYLRAVGDLCRAYAVVGFDKDFLSLILDLVEYDSFKEVQWDGKLVNENI